MPPITADAINLINFRDNAVVGPLIIRVLARHRGQVPGRYDG